MKTIFGIHKLVFILSLFGVANKLLIYSLSITVSHLPPILANDMLVLFNKIEFNSFSYLKVSLHRFAIALGAVQTGRTL